MKGQQLGAIAIVAGAVGALLWTAPLSGGWKQIEVTRASDTTEATLSYERRPDPYPGIAWADLRRITLVVRRDGRTVVDYRYPHILYGSVSRFVLRNVWGDSPPEALLELWTGGNACCERILIGLAGPGGRGRIVRHDFSTFGWSGQQHDGTYDFITGNAAFYCAFTSCADASQPIQIFAIDKSGSRLVDVTRTRPDLIAADAAAQWQAYRREIVYHQYQHGSHSGSDPIGILAPWCADEYLLRRRSSCLRALDRAVAHGYLDGWHSGYEAGINGLKGGPAIVARVLETLVAWGYDAPAAP